MALQRTSQSQSILKAIDEIRNEFPFLGYVTGTSEGTFELVNEVLTLTSGVTKDPGGLQLLDIGCGPMDVTAVFAKMGLKCSAVDDLSDPWHLIDDNRLHIERFAELQGIRFHRHEPPQYSIPFAEGSFDIVLLGAVIEHLHGSPRQFLNTAFRYARPLGFVVVTMPNSVNLRKRLSVLRGKTNYPPIEGFLHSPDVWRGHVREYTLAETRYLLEETGGRVVLARTFHELVDKKVRHAAARSAYRVLTALMPTLKDSVMVVAQKPTDWQQIEFDEEIYRRSVIEDVPEIVLRDEKTPE